MHLENLFETKIHENKQILNEGEKAFGWLKTVCAFANTQGGTISIGVSDDFKIIGLKKEQVDKQVQLFLRETKEHLKPLPKFEFAYEKTDKDTYILNINVLLSKTLPVILTFHNIPSIYIREEGRNVPADSEQIQTLVFSSFPEKFDTIKTEESFDINSYTILNEKYLNEHKTELTKKKLISMNAIDDDSTVLKGLLLFKDNFKGNETLIKITKWRRLSKGDDIFESLYEGNSNIISNIDSALKIISDNISSVEKKLPIGRETIYDYPIRSIFEGLVNAYAHKNYFFKDTPIEVDIFINRIEITSPGRLVNAVNIYNEKNIVDIQPNRRNEVICNIFSSIRYMEKEGSGFDKISEDYQKQPEIYKPFVTSLNSYFKLTLPNINSFGIISNDDEILPITTAFDSNLTERQKIILGYCYLKARSIEEIANKIGMKVSTYLRNQIIGQLINKNLLTQNYISKAIFYSSNRETVEIKINCKISR